MKIINKIIKIARSIAMLLLIIITSCNVVFYINNIDKFNYSSVTIDLICLSVIFIGIQIFFKFIGNFDTDEKLYDARRIVVQYMYVVLINIFINSSELLKEWGSSFFEIYLYFLSALLIVGVVFFAKRFNGNSSNPRGKELIVNLIDSRNLNTFILKGISYVLYQCSIIYFYRYRYNLNNTNSMNYNWSGTFEKMIYFFIVAYSIYGILLTAISFGKFKEGSLEERIYRMIGIIFGIIIFFGIGYSFIWLNDIHAFSFNDILTKNTNNPLGIDLNVSSVILYFKIIINFTYYSIITFSTTGFGDICPSSAIVKIVVLLEVISEFIVIFFAIGMFFKWDVNKKSKECNLTKWIVKFWRKITVNKIKNKFIQSILALVLIIICINLLFAIIYYINRNYFSLGAETSSIFNFIYFAIITFATVGYGDIFPIHIISRILVSAQLIIQFIIMIFAINIVNSNFKDTSQINNTKVGRNDSCSCGSGKKYKNCCGKNI